MPECPGCLRELPEDDFYADKSRGTGRSRLCRECHSQHYRDKAKVWYQKNKESHIAKVLAHRKDLKSEKPEPSPSSK
jgi:hypothetical protein